MLIILKTMVLKLASQVLILIPLLAGAEVSLMV